MMKRLGSAALAFAIAAAIVPAAPFRQQASADDVTIDMNRLYNPNSGEHFYTADDAERDVLTSIGWQYEGVGWTAPASSSTPVHRLYNENAGDHHYTMNQGESDFLVSVGWNYEGIGWYSDDAQGVPLHRQYNPNALAGSHNYTTDAGERDFLVSLGWHNEDIAWYGVDTSGFDQEDNADSGDSNASGDDSPNPSEPVLSFAEQTVAKVKKYSYTIRPVNGSLNNIFFVETDNPDPYSFQFVDSSSKYLDAGEKAAIKPLTANFCDVDYSDVGTRRIANKGYLFYDYSCSSDGGSLELMASTEHYSQVTGWAINYWGSAYDDSVNYETGIAVSCPALEDRADYLIRTCAAGKTSLFDKLDAVQSKLKQIALYSKAVRDTDKPTGKHPFLASSPYPELGLNNHIEGMYEAGAPLFIDAIYGFVLDSVDFPRMMGSVAKRLQSDCEVSDGVYHYMVKVTYGGETKTYGGAGEGSTYPIFMRFVSKNFKFDGTDTGFGTNLSMDKLMTTLLDYASKSDQFAKNALDALSVDNVAKAIGTGGWIKIGMEGHASTAESVGYAIIGPMGWASYASDAWVDGRYVNNLELYERGQKFSDHPTADIILQNVTYTDVNGKRHMQDVRYDYDSAHDYWSAYNYYMQSYYGSSPDESQVPSELKLTRVQVEKMVASGKIDGKSSEIPTAQYIYDGTAAPGTPVK